MKNLVLTALVLTASLFSGFVGLDLRPSFSFEIFSSPYYRIQKKDAPLTNARIGFVPAMLDARASQIPTYADARIPQLLAAINRFAQDSLQLMQLTINPANKTDAPDLFLGSVLPGDLPPYVSSDCASAKDYPEYCLRIAGQLGSKTWMQQLETEMEKNQLDYALFFQLGEGYIYPNGKTKQLHTIVETRKAPQAGLDLGTYFWLPMAQKRVAVNKPINVLFIKGMLIGKDGKVVRFGGEGITVASKAGFQEPVVNIEHGFSEEELNQIEQQTRRDDLPAKPLNWQVAAKNLVQTLTTPYLKVSGGYVKQ